MFHNRRDFVPYATACAQSSNRNTLLLQPEVRLCSHPLVLRFWAGTPPTPQVLQSEQAEDRPPLPRDEVSEGATLEVSYGLLLEALIIYFSPSVPGMPNTHCPM